MPTPYSRLMGQEGEDIVYAIRNNGIRDERTGKNEPLVYELSYQGHGSVAKFGTDKC